MNISFDLDGTLIPFGNEFETEKRYPIAKLFGIELIRKGTPELILALKRKGHEIHIYTTSFRTKRKIRRTLRYYGITVGKIVNQVQNERVLKANKINASKHPRSFGFDLHIDDSKGVGLESERFKFQVIIVEPAENEWASRLLTEIEMFI